MEKLKNELVHPKVDNLLFSKVSGASARQIFLG